METFKISLFTLLKSKYLIDINGLLLCNVVNATESLLKATCASRMPVDFYFEDQVVTVSDGMCTAIGLFIDNPTVKIIVKVVRNPTVADFDELFPS